MHSTLLRKMRAVATVNLDMHTTMKLPVAVLRVVALQLMAITPRLMLMATSMQMEVNLPVQFPARASSAQPLQLKTALILRKK